MTLLQKLFGILTVLTIFWIIIQLVKKGKLREEYSWLWLLTGLILIIVVLWYDLLLIISKLIGAVYPTTTLFIFGIVFLILLSLHFAIKISHLTYEVKNLAQKISFLEAENEQGDPGDKPVS
ncbi:MAG: DUF2304 domain-containing protein [Desulfobacteraceae bacterium]|nr:MAG: DUF2304 domain-containing protein [Desulfobacteraceae bacterium]